MIGSTNTGLLSEITVHSPDLLLLDNGLCDVPGHLQRAELKQDPSTGRLPIVLLSDHPDLSMIAERGTADAYLAKPFDTGALLDLVRRLHG